MTAARVRAVVLAAVVATAWASGPAAADGSTPELVAGGLVLPANAGVAVKSEDLHISEKAIDIAYEFLNAGDKDVTTLVAFPLPVLSPADSEIFEARDGGDPVDFLGFTVDVDGRRIKPQAEQRASVLGLDVTDRLVADGVALNPYVGARAREALAKLPAAKQGFYAERGLAVWLEGAPTGLAWTVSTTFHWMQTFPAGKAVRIVHHYRPIVGRDLLTEATLDRLAGGRAGVCLDKTGEAALRKALVAGRKAGGGSTALMQRRVGFALGAGAGWGGPIGNFRLTIDKPRADTLVATCFAGAPPKIGPTSLVWEAKDFTPKDDLSILFVDLGEK
ncbi:DUF4424 family protein [Siculibacillus lacustris]|uniref:DUF4424 family protein n=1 Tax=Siculibacillus lacustris TaxID=1549641 RepID=UPI0013F1440A|nr:DUF4424 family protein [Siculibacillus lacustris]